MRIYGDCPGFFRDSLVVGSVCQNDHRNFQHHALTAAFNVFIATARRKDAAHIAKLPPLSSKLVLKKLPASFKQIPDRGRLPYGSVKSTLASSYIYRCILRTIGTILGTLRGHNPDVCRQPQIAKEEFRETLCHLIVSSSTHLCCASLCSTLASRRWTSLWAWLWQRR